MKCFECFRNETSREAVALCHHCSAALCSEHAQVVDDPIQTIYPVAKTVVLPVHARRVLCDTCKTAIAQSHQKVTTVELRTA
jgi:hypothetical protein